MTPTRILVCGDSFFSCDLGHPGTHFSELLASHYGCELVSLARQGISTNSIRLQLAEFAKHQPDLVILGGTDQNRFEVPMQSLYPADNFAGYNPQHGLGNIEYRHYPNLSKNFVDNSHCTMWSDHVSKFFDETAFPQDVVTAWKYYLSFLFDPAWKKQQDDWVVESSLFFLTQQAVAYLYMPNGNYVPSHVAGQNLLEHVISEQNDDGRSYHTADYEQQVVFQLLVQKINEL